MIALGEERPQDTRWQLALADCYEQLAEVHRAAGKDAAADLASAEALVRRERLAEVRPDDAPPQIDLLTARYAAPVDASELKNVATLSQRIIDQWPSDAGEFYEAACRLTGRTPVASVDALDSDSEASDIP